MTFKIYYSPTGGTPLWSETQTSVRVEKGLFNVILGSVNPIPGDVFPSGGSRWLETEIGGPTLTPRKEIVSVAYAFRAAIADQLIGPTHTCEVICNTGTAQPLRLEANGPIVLTADRDNNDPGSRVNFYINGEADANMKMTIFENGNVGIGTTNPQNKLDVEGAVAIGTDYSGTATAPTDGMIIEGKVGIGTALVDANAKFEVEGGRVYITDNYPILTFNNDGGTGPDIWIASSNFNPPAGDFMIYQTSPASRRILSYYLLGPKLALMADGGNVGIGMAEPHTKLHVAGPIATAVRNVAISSTVTQEDSIVVVTGTATGITITLPSAVGIKGRQYTIKNMNPSSVTVATTGWELIDRNPTYLLPGLTLTGIGKSITVVSDGTDWLIIAEIK